MKYWHPTILAVGWVPFILLSDYFSDNLFLKVAFGIIAGVWIFTLAMVTIKQLSELIRNRKK